MESVYCVVGAGSLNKTSRFALKGLNVVSIHYWFRKLCTAWKLNQIKKQKRKVIFSWCLIKQHILKTCGVMEVYIHAFITLALNAVEWW